MSAFFIRGALVARPGDAAPVVEDLRIEDGRVAAAGADLPKEEGLEDIDASGRVLLPGLCDAHVHIREPGREDSETIRSASEAALAGGFTHVLSMPNTDPLIDTGGMVAFVQSMARSGSRIPISVAGCLTVGRAGEKLAEIADMAERGAVMVTDCERPVRDPYILRRALEYTRHFDVVVGVYPDTPALTGEGVMHEGEVSFRLGLPGIPAVSEEIAIERDLRIARATGGRIHIQNVSTAEGVASIRRFKAEGLEVTAEVTPHHLLLTHECLEGYDTHFKMMPPLRPESDRLALLEGVRDGTLDLIATGHAPHTDFEKNLDFQHAPFGVIGLETALPALAGNLAGSGQVSWNRLAEALSAAPRRLLKLEPISLAPGSRFEAVLFDPEGETRVERGELKSRSFNTPWLHQTLKGRVLRTFLC